MLTVRDHWLEGADVTRQPTPNTGGPLRPRYLVLHYTAGRSLESSVQSLCTRKPQGNASAHLVLGRDGRIVQLAPFNLVTWHAGVSQWAGLNGLNPWAIGIEMDNAGLLQRQGDRCCAWFGQAYPAEEIVEAAHAHGGGVQPWHAYTPAQIERALALCELLVGHYGLEDVLGHEDIARGRKCDPGPAFPMEAVRAQALGRGSDTPPRWVVNATRLNIRSAPSADAPKLAAALPRGTELIALEPRDRWTRVAVVGMTDLEGWVCNDFIARLPQPRHAATDAAPPARWERLVPATSPRARRTAATTTAQSPTRGASRGAARTASRTQPR